MKERLMIIRLITQLMWFKNFMVYRGVMPTDLEPYLAYEIKEAKNLVNWLSDNVKDT